MEKIVEAVLKAEQVAESAVAEAREKAAKLKNTVEQSIAEQFKDTHAAAQQLIKEGIEKARKTAETEYKTAVEEADKANLTFLEDKRVKINELVGQVVNLISVSELNR